MIQSRGSPSPSSATRERRVRTAELSEEQAFAKLLVEQPESTASESAAPRGLKLTETAVAHNSKLAP
jgi:hypothetical protein